MTKTAHIIIADNEVDQVCETRSDALTEQRDLREMGCRVHILVCPWDEQDDYISEWNEVHQS